MRTLKRRRVYYDFGVTRSVLFFCASFFSLFRSALPLLLLPPPLFLALSRFLLFSLSRHLRSLYVTSVVGKRRAHCR